MKRLLNTITVLSVAALYVAGCSEMQDLEKRLDTLESKVTALETVLPGLNENISSVQTLLEGGLLIREVRQSAQGGYILVLSDGREISLSTESAVSDSHFASVSYKDDLFTVTLKEDGTTISIPVVPSFLFKIAGTDGVQYFESGQTKEYSVEKQGVVNAVVTVPDGWTGILEGNALKVTAPALAKSFIADSRSDVSVIAVSSQGFSVVAKMKVEIGAESTPDPTPDPAPVTYTIGDVVEGGVLYWISKDGTTGKVLYPNRSEKISFSTESPAPGLTTESSETDGEANVSAMKAVDATLAKYPSAKYCDDLDGDWYLPAKNELRDLLSVYNGTYDPDADPGTWNVTNAKPEGLTDAEKAARAAFDAYISNAGGVILNTASESNQGDVYWASTWATSFEKSRTIRFGQRADQSQPVTSTYYTRCIKKVSLSGVTAVPDLPEQKDGEYDLYLLIGQSNMAGRGEMLAGDDAEIEGAYLLNGENGIVVASNPINRFSSALATSENEAFSLGASFAKAVYKETGRKVLLVSNARGSTDIEQWDGVSGNEETGKEDYNLEDYFATTVARTKAAVAKGGQLRAILWHQGCSDISEYNTTYMSTLATLVANYRKELGDVPFIAGEINQWRGGTYSKFNTMIQTIGSNISNSDWVSSDDLVNLASEATLNDGKGGPHFDRASLIVFGERYAEKVLKKVYGIDYTASSMPTE